jgi:hypothetical protein
MKILFWNIRGMGRKARVRQLKELIGGGEHVDIVGIHETIKKNFFVSELESLALGKGFSWKWAEGKGHSGGSSWGLKRIFYKWRIGRLESFSWL